ncbi:MAG: protein kinase [Terriglobales bacterium]
MAGFEHENIARLLDGGTTDEGYPYFVMELVEGKPIDEYCDEGKLGTAVRLDLFQSVCSAVQYAHQRLVVHRDIKPSNILVTADGVPKLLDFGIATILSLETDSPGGDPTLTAQRMMTPQFASPEQLRGEVITTATDVYSLGVVLYKLLTGRLPYRLDAHSPYDLAHAICEVEPEKPSSVVGHSGQMDRQITPEWVSVCRNTSPEKLRRTLSGDLDQILLKALRKEPQRRYPSVQEFAQDLHSYTLGLPVSARGDTFSYRSGKFIKRNKLALAAAAIFALVVLAGAVAIVREARIARMQQARAERRFNDVRQLANSLLFDIHDSIQHLPGSTAARKILVDHALQYLDSLAAEAGGDIPLQRELAAGYQKLASVQGGAAGSNLGDTQGALKSLRHLVRIREAIAAVNRGNVQDQRDLASGYSALSLALQFAGDNAGAAENSAKSVQIREALVRAAPSRLDLVTDLAMSYRDDIGGALAARNDLAGALTKYEQSLQLFQQVANSAPQNMVYQRNLSFAHKRVAATLAASGKLSEGLEHDRTALGIDEKLMAANPSSTQARYDITFTYSDIGYILGKRGELDAALASYREALGIRESLAAADPRDMKVRAGVARTYGYIYALLQQRGSTNETLVAARAALKIRETMVSADPENMHLRAELTRSQIDMGFACAAAAAKAQETDAQLALWHQAQMFLQRALSAWPETIANDSLSQHNGAPPSSISAKLSECKAAIARLETGNLAAQRK